MAESLEGGCLCGAVRFALELPTAFLSHCHCRSCRLSHGAAFVTWTAVPEARFRFLRGEGALRWYASSAAIRWGFCGICGSSMLYRAVADGHPEAPALDRVYVTAASLDGPLDRAPQSHVSYEERVDWLAATDGLPCFRGKGEAPVDP